MPHGRGRRSQRLRTVSVRDISRQIHSSGHARLFQQRSSLFLQIIRHRGHLGGKTRYAARGARMRALQSGQHAVADAVAGVCVRIIGGVRHMRHAAARQISQDIRPLRPQQRAHIRPAHRRDARGSAGRAAAGQIEQHRFGIVGASVRRCDLRAVRLCQPCKKSVPFLPAPLLARVFRRREQRLIQRNTPRRTLGAHKGGVPVCSSAAQAVVHMSRAQTQPPHILHGKQKME